MTEANPNNGGALNLRQAADQLASLNLFGDAPQGDAPEGAPEGEQGDTQADTREGDSPDDAPDTDQSEDDGQDQALDTDVEDTQDETKDADVDTSSEAEDTAPDIQSLGDLKEALEADDDFIGNLTHTFNAAGEQVTVTLSELQKGYQKDAHFRRQTQELADQRRTMEAEQQQRAKDYEGNLTKLGHFFMEAKKLLAGDADSPEMHKLRSENVTEWNARMFDMQRRAGQVDQLFANAAKLYDEHQKKQSETSDKSLQELKTKELDKLYSYIPDWDEGMNNKVSSYLMNEYGYSLDDIKGVSDSRLVVLANKARQFDEMKKIGTKTKKKINKLPKLQKPTKGPVKPNNKKAVNVKKAQSRLKQTGKLRDAAALFNAMEIDI